MMSFHALLLVLSARMAVLRSDCYMHMPRGSNNRLNEQAANRNNANRLFDSQNNNRGGYNVGDLDTEDGFNANNYMATTTQMYGWDFLYQTDAAYERQYEMLYFEGSELSVTWTNQHGTGNRKLLSQMILQFGCDTVPRPATGNGADGFGPNQATNNADNTRCNQACKERLATMKGLGLRMELMNGGNTGTPANPGQPSTIQATYAANNDAKRGRHESEEWYELCERRSRNYGLFHADQDLNGKTQKYTRQNPAGTRRGLECPEERDYYPWWNPSPWRDIAIITPEVDYCKKVQAPNSQNVKEKCTCSNPQASGTATNPDAWFPAADYIEDNLNQTNCEANEGKWTCFKWDSTEPECVESYWSKVNYLGNVDGTTRGGKQAHYDWKLPSFADLKDKHYCWPYEYDVDQSTHSNQDSNAKMNCVRMVFRLRYNMSTMDYDPYKTDSRHDHKPGDGILSPIEENPVVDVGELAQGLRLAINTAQTGRTFQDRSHTFLVCERGDFAKSAWKNTNVDLINVNVRGKRGNIVQTFPATEYDFEPQHIELSPSKGMCLHFQWTGSNTHNNGAPGGDGQTGDAGEGRGGSDRSNLVQSRKADESYPVTYDKLAEGSLRTPEGEMVHDFFDLVECYHPLNPGVTVSKKDAQLILGTAGFYRGEAYMKAQCDRVAGYNNGENRANCVVDELLNNVSGSFRAGLICCVKPNQNCDTKKTYSFISTRNNNFTNRSQKLKIVCSTEPDEKKNW